MKTKTVVPAIVLIAAAGVVYWSLGSDERTAPGAPRHTPVPEPSASAPSLEPEERDAEATLPKPTEVAAELEAVSREAVDPNDVEPAWNAEETRWFDVHVALPDGTPLDETPSVVALAETGDYASIYGADGPVAELDAGTHPNRIKGVLGVAEVGPNGVARMGVGPDVREVWLVARGFYLHSLAPRQAVLADRSARVELRPSLGAWISGRLIPAVASDAAALEGIEVELDWSLTNALSLGAAGRERLSLDTTTDAAGGFEFRAVPLGKPQTITTKSDAFAATIRDQIEPVPGEHLSLELALIDGGSVRGRIVNAAGAPVTDAIVRAAGIELLGNPTVRFRETTSGGDGGFDLTKVTPGKTWLYVEHEDYSTLLSAAFELSRGQVLEYGDVVLDDGFAISGTVTFPGSEPGTGARVSVSPDLSENIAGGPMDQRDFIGASNSARVESDGSFRIPSVGPGPWSVTAELEVDAESDVGARAAGRWTATRALVRAPADDLALVLDPPITVSGTAHDANDDPLASFTIHAERSGTQWYMPPSEERDQSFESDDGRFELTGLRPGEWKFTAVAEGFAKTEEVALTLPTDDELTFVLQRSARLIGKVVDPDGEPIAGAEVTKELEGAEAIEAMQGRGDWPKTRSDDQGAFVLDGLAPGAGSIFAKKDGHAASEAVAYELAEGDVVEGILLTLRRGGTIAGEVYAADGSPAAGCVLILQMPTLAERRFTNADAAGKFAERGLKPGMWQVQAFPGIESLQSNDGGAVDQAQLMAALKMASVELADETEEYVVLGAPPADPVRVHGRVTLDGEGVSGAVISFVPTGAGGGTSFELLKLQTVEDDGTYALQLDEPGDYVATVQVIAIPGRQQSIEYPRSIPAGADVTLDFELPLGRIEGRVEGPDGRPAANARVTLNMDGGFVFGTLFGGHYQETATDEDGNYALPFLRPGRYAVAAGGVALGGLLGMGDGDTLGRQVVSVDVPGDEAVRGVDFRLAEPGDIRGTVRDNAGEPVASASIFVRDENGHLVELFSMAETNASGTFEYPGLAPGNYTVTARTKAFVSHADLEVRVRSGEVNDVTIVLDSGTILIVTLTDQTGQDVRSRVSVLDEEGREMNGMIGLSQLMERISGGVGSTDQRVGPLPPGRYEVRAEAEDGRSTRRPVSLSGQAERKVKLRLK